MRFYDAGDIRLHLPWPRMLAALEDALRGDVNAPLRVNHAIEVPGKQPASLLLMPAWRAGRRIGVKLVTVFPGNAERGRRSVAAIYAMFDANDGTPIWAQPASLGSPIKPRPRPHPGYPHATVIDRWGINILWGILSTPVIDLDTQRMYVVNWTSPDGTVDNSAFELHAIDITNGQDVSAPLAVAASAPSQPSERPYWRS